MTSAIYRQLCMPQLGTRSCNGSAGQAVVELLDGLKAALKLLRQAGCQRVFVNRSFVTDKNEPGNINVAWDPRDVDVDRLLEVEPVFGDFADRRAAQKAKFGCEFFPSSFTADLVGITFLEFFQIDKETEAQKGIVALDL